jgi:hypothetical protein
MIASGRAQFRAGDRLAAVAVWRGGDRHVILRESGEPGSLVGVPLRDAAMYPDPLANPQSFYRRYAVGVVVPGVKRRV